jgi:hypothetical protein
MAKRGEVRAFIFGGFGILKVMSSSLKVKLRSIEKDA